MPRYLSVTFGIALALIASSAVAVERSELEKSSIKAATDCVARVALNNENIVTFYRENRLKQVTDWIVQKSSACNNPLKAMRMLHDRIYGAGTGRHFLFGDYLDDLPRAVRERISDDIEQSFAYAPSPPIASQLSSGTELVVVNVAPNDVLKIREYATDNSRVIDVIPPNARGVTYLGESQGQWIFVRYENRAEGWVYRHFVQPITSRGRSLQ